MKSQYNLRWYHFISAWLLCLVSSIVLMMLYFIVVNGRLEGIFLAILTAIIALIASAPFIIAFCLIMHFTVLKNGFSRRKIHLRALMWHLIGTFCVFVGMIVFTNDLAQDFGFFPLLGILTGYFLLDSIYFHVFIHYQTKNSEPKLKEDMQLLDS